MSPSRPAGSATGPSVTWRAGSPRSFSIPAQAASCPTPTVSFGSGRWMTRRAPSRSRNATTTGTVARRARWLRNTSTPAVLWDACWNTPWDNACSCRLRGGKSGRSTRPERAGSVLHHESEVPDAAIEPGQDPGRLIGDHGVLGVGPSEPANIFQGPPPGDDQDLHSHGRGPLQEHGPRVALDRIQRDRKSVV